MIAELLRKEWVAPVRLAFFGSILLSLIAVLGEATVGKDAAFYLDIARQTVEQGPEIATQRFNWPWFVYLLAYTHKASGIPLELLAYLWCGLFLAGACALLTDCVRRVRPELAYWACLVVLAVPAYNALRGDILREYGFWFGTALTLWLAMRWQARGGWLLANAIHGAILLAVLFRLEAVLLFAALFSWRLFHLRGRDNWLRLAQLAALPVLGLLLGGTVLLSSDVLSQQRVAYYLSLLNPEGIASAFERKSDLLAEALFAKYMTEQAGVILLIMLVGTVALFYFMLCGPLAAVFLHRSGWQALADFWRDWKLFALSALAYVAVLLVFLLHQDFINSRYASYLHLLSVPLLSLAIMSFCQRFPRLGKALVALLVIQMLANVISTGAKKTHYVEAGHWLAEHVEAPADMNFPAVDIYFEDGRIAYYAGFGYPIRPEDYDQAKAMSSDEQGKFRYLVIEAKADEPWLQEWLAEHDRVVLAEFANRKRKTVLVIGHAEAQSSPGISSEESPDAAR